MSESTAVAEVTQATTDAPTQTTQVTESRDPELEEALSLLENIEGKRETQDPASTEGAKDGTETEGELDEVEEAAITAAREAAAEEATVKAREDVTREMEERNQRVARQREVEGIKQSFDTRAQGLRAVLSEVIGDATYQVGDRQVSGSEIVNWALEQFNSHHGQSSIVTHSRYREGLLDYAKQELGDEGYAPIAKGEEEGKFPNYRALNKAVSDAIRADAKKGLFTEAQVKEREARTALKLQRAFRADPDRFLSRTNTATSREGSPRGVARDPDQMSSAEVNAMLAKAGV